MLTLYDFLPSGNGYKVRLLLSQLRRPFELVQLDIFGKRETRTPEFLARNPNGRIPCLRLEDGTYLWESNAICFYLAEGTPFLPADRLERAQVLQWLFFEQYSHEPYIAVVRSWHEFGLLDQGHNRLLLSAKLAGGYAALGVMESHLAKRAFFVAERYTIADIGLYAYTHVAEEGKFDLGPYPAVRAWLERVRAQPLHVPITKA
ncbi:MAG TPA: glutathione S-transferase family protein [Myxococcota bacterium]|nr:glutathione S-transferase family protein [Myxococcota bacterium]